MKIMSKKARKFEIRSQKLNQLKSTKEEKTFKSSGSYMGCEVRAQDYRYIGMHIIVEQSPKIWCKVLKYF